MRSRLLALSTVIALTACISGTVKVHDVCNEESLTSIPAGLPTTIVQRTFETQADFSEVLSKVDNYGDVTVGLSRIELTSQEKTDLSFVRHLRIEFVSNDGLVQFLGEETVAGPTQSILVRVRDTTPEMQRDLKRGPFKLRITGEVTPPTTGVTPMVRVCGSVTGEGSYSVSDIGK